MHEESGQSMDGAGADNSLELLANALDRAYEQAMERGPSRLARLGPGAVVYAMRERILRLRDAGVGWAEITALLNEQLVTMKPAMSVHQKTVETVIRPLAKARGVVPPAAPPAPPLQVVKGGAADQVGDQQPPEGGAAQQLTPFRGRERER